MEEQILKEDSNKNVKKIDPKNFFLETERRAKSRSQTPLKEDQEFQFKARPKPEYKHFVLQKSDHKQIEFKEFDLSTENRGRTKEQQLKLKLENEKKQEDLKRNFHAQEIPDYNELSSQFKLSKCPATQATQPVEFKLETDKRIEQSGLRKQQQSQSAEKYEFKARKMPDFTKNKSPTKPSPKKSTTPVNVMLNSTQRAEQRKLFEEQTDLNSQKEKLSQNSADENTNIKEEQELEDIKQTSAFKAQPIRKYKQLEIQKGVIPLTQPESPKFKIDERLRTAGKLNKVEKQQQEEEQQEQVEQQQQQQQQEVQVQQQNIQE